MVRARSLLTGILVIGLAVATASPAGAADNDRKNLIARIVAKADPKLMEVVVTNQVGEGRPTFKIVKVSTLANAKDVVGKFLGKSGVRAVEMNHTVKALANDPYYSQQWPMQSDQLDFSRIRTITKKDTAHVTVAVVDTGVQGNHPDLANHMTTGYTHLPTCGLLSCRTQSGETSSTTNNDDCGHGTHVAGIVTAQVNNGIGVAGLAQLARIRSVKVLGSDCSGSTADTAAGITWAADHAQVINLSFGSPDYTSAENAAVQYAIHTKHRVVVAAAGNCDDPNCTTPLYPAAYSGVIGVAATSWDKKRASFSSYGSWVDVGAPGYKIVSTYPTNGYAVMYGPSMVTPYVAAAAALGIEHCHWSGLTTISKIQKTASHPSTKDKWTGYGVIRPTVMLRC